MVETVIYNPVIVLVKVSILLQYITVFVAHRGNLLHYGCHILIWINVLFYTALTLVYIFQVSIFNDHSAAVRETNMSSVYASSEVVEPQNSGPLP